ALQIRGGRGYETATSLAARGEPAIALERFLRDSRINTIFEGSSEIMRLFIAREALDPHLKIGAPVLNKKIDAKERRTLALKAFRFYAAWYPRQWCPLVFGLPADLPGPVRKHLRRVKWDSQRLARAMFHAMVRHGPKLERQQMLLGRFVDIATELFVTTAVCLRWAQLQKQPDSEWQNVSELAEYFCEKSRVQVNQHFRGVRKNTDKAGYRVARSVLEKKHLAVEEGM
ncbi:MAG: DUF1974 domain-containing protein, partial [Verrucomicrobia bacterium]|nr:DUF1974 domain-containing protein [Verrucomicrobiota bacterium]